MLIDSVYTPEAKMRIGVSYKKNNFNSVISNVAYSLKQQRARGRQLESAIFCRIDKSLISEKFRNKYNWFFLIKEYNKYYQI